MSARRAAARSGRVRGPVIPALIVLLALAVVVARTWLAHRETEAVRPESTQPTPSGLEASYAPIPSAPPASTSHPPPSSRLEIDPAPATSEPSSTPPDPVQQVVWGFVLDEEGRPLTDSAWAWVRFVDRLGQDRTVRPEADGSYSMPGLGAGRWFAQAQASRRKAQEVVLDLDPGGPSLRQDFQLAAQPSVRVRLLAPDRRPFPEVARELGLSTWELVAVATLEPPGERFEQVHGSLNNRFGVGSMWFNGQGDVSLPAEYFGRIDLHADPPVHVSLVLYHEVLESRRVEDGQDEVSFTLDPARIQALQGGIELELVDSETGAALVGATAQLAAKGGGGTRQTTDGTGRVRIEGQDPGLYDLWLSAQGKAALQREVDVPRGRVVDLGRIALPAAHALHGRAVDGTGAGLRAEITVRPLPASGELPPSGGLTNSSNADGSFEIAGLAPGRWLLQAKDRMDGRLQGNAAELMSPNLLVDTRAGPIEDLVVRLLPVSHVVVTWSGADRESLRMRFFDEHGWPRQGAGFWTPAPMRIDLLPGSWRMEVIDGAGLALAQTSFVLGDEPVVLELGPGR